MNQQENQIFNLRKLSLLLNKVTSDKDKSLIKAKEYINSFFIPTSKGIFFYNDEPHNKHFELIQMNKLTPNYLSDDLKAYKIEKDEKEGSDGTVITKTKKKLCFDAIKYLKSTEFLQNKYVVTINQKIFSRIYEKNGINYLNMMKPRLHRPNTLKKYQSYSQEVKEGVDAMLNHIKTVWASDNESVYKYMLNWLSCSCMGKKLRTLLYLQSTERTGKSIVIDFIQNYVLGPHATYVTSSTEVIDKWTKPLEGRMLVNFNELPCAGLNQWRGVMDCIKSLVTEPYMSVTQRYCDSYIQNNTFNVIITTNNNAININVNNHARIVSADVSESRLGDYEYFGNLKNKTSNFEVGKAFMAYMKEHFESEGQHFNCDMKPTTESMKDKIASNLPVHVDFIKNAYIKVKEDIDTITDDFYTNYMEYCNDEKRKPLSKPILGSQLTNLGIKKTRRSVRGNRSHYYVANYKDIMSLFQKKMWIHDTDEIMEEDMKHESDLEKRLKIIMNDLEETRKQLKQSKDDNVNLQKLIKDLEEPEKEKFDDGLDDEDAFDNIGLDDEEEIIESVPKTAPKSNKTKQNEVVAKETLSKMKTIKRKKIESFDFQL